MIGDDFRVKAGGLDHDQERVVAADQVAQVLPGLHCRIVSPDEKQEELTQLVKLTSLEKNDIGIYYSSSIIIMHSDMSCLSFKTN